MIIKTTIFLLFPCLILFSHCAANQKGQPTCPIDFPTSLDHESTQETHKEAVLELMEVTRTKENSDTLMLNLVAQRIAKNPELAPIKHVLEEYVLENMSFDTLKEGYIEIYMNHFTELEIRQLNALQKLDINQKFAEKMPKITVEIANYATEHLTESAEEINKIINEYLDKQEPDTNTQ